MSKVEFFVTPGYGDRNLEKFHSRRPSMSEIESRFPGKAATTTIGNFLILSKRKSSRRSRTWNGRWRWQERPGRMSSM